MTALIQVSELVKIFEGEDVLTHALNGVHLAIESGEFVSVMGPSGSGKTTLLAVLGLMERPTRGQYLLGGRSVTSLADAALSRLRNREVGFIFQSFNLIGDLDVEHNVAVPLVYRRVPPDERRERVARILERVGMAHRSRHMPSQLSGGQQQRVAIARALVGEPSILLADEPTGNLDSTNGAEVLRLLDDLHARGATVCMVTHNPEYAQRAERIIRLMDGRIVEELS